MGFKQCRQIVVCLAVMLFMKVPVYANASSVDNLYELYNIDYSTELDSTVTETIRGYENAKKYVEMFHHVSTAEFDINIIKDELKSIDERLKEIEDSLFAGYFLPIDDIYLLEDEYNTLMERRADLTQVKTSDNIDYVAPNVETVPSYDVYKEALKTRNEFNAQKEIGLLDGLDYPLQSKSIIYDSNSMFTTFKTIENTGVLCLFNGQVEDIKDTADGLTVTINHYNNVVSTYSYLEETSLRVGDTVYQNQSIGFLLGNKLTVQLSLNGEYVDVTKLYNKE